MLRIVVETQAKCMNLHLTPSLSLHFFLYSLLLLLLFTMKFKSQLDTLMKEITTTQVQYVRCIKPNDENVSQIITRDRVLGQLRCGGVLEAVRVARAGFPIRMLHQVFLSRYYLLILPRYVCLHFYT